MNRVTELASLARIVLSARIPIRRPEAFLNARGQVLTMGDEVESDLPARVTEILEREAKVVGALVSNFAADITISSNVRRCHFDGGGAYIQAEDLVTAAIRQYFLVPFLCHVVESYEEGSHEIEAVSHAAIQSLEAQTVTRRILTPLLGVDVENGILLESGVSIRPIAECERQHWYRDEPNPGIARDILGAASVLEVTFASTWGAATRPDAIDVRTFTAEGTNAALDTSRIVVGLLRLVASDVPLIFSEEQIVELPWVRNTMVHRPSSADTHRRFDRSPLLVRMVVPEQLDLESSTALVACWPTISAQPHDSKLKRALRLLTQELDWIVLYKIYELWPPRYRRGETPYASKSESSRFSHTANSPEVLGDWASRHAVVDTTPPSAPMTLAHARTLIRKVTLGWILDELRKAIA